MASFIPRFISQVWHRDPWVQPENRVTRSVAVSVSPSDVEDEAPMIGASEDSRKGRRPDEAA